MTKFCRSTQVTVLLNGILYWLLELKITLNKFAVSLCFFGSFVMISLMDLYCTYALGLYKSVSVCDDRQIIIVG